MSKVIIARILIILVMMCAAWFVSKRAGHIGRRLALVAGALVTGILAAALVSALPDKTEPVTITVLEESNAKAKSSEAFLKRIQIDGKQTGIPAPTEGKWFFRGERYGYRPDSDTRRPDGLTRSITLELPLGADRQLVFTKNSYGGIVSITTPQTTVTKDLYAKRSGEATVTIGATPVKELRFYKLQCLVLFGVFYCIGMALFILLLRLLLKKWERICEFSAVKWDYYIYFAIACYVLLVCLLNITEDSLWYDEVWNVGWYASGDIIYNQYSHHFLMSIWYHLMPFGEQYLLLLTELISAAGVFLTGVAGRKLGGKRVGIFATVSVAAIPYFYRQVATEYRNYYLLYFAVVLMFLVYLWRGAKKQVPVGRILVYSLCLTLVMDSHQYGMLVAAVFMGMDFLMLVFKRIPWKNVLGFLFPVLYMVMWLYTNDMGGMWNDYGWTKVPDAKMVYNTIYLLCGASVWMVGLLILGTVCSIRDYLTGLIYGKRGVEEELHDVMPILAIGGVFFASILYSVCINPDNSLYVERYFICILPFIVLLIGKAFDFLLEGLSALFTADKRTRMAQITAIALGLSILLNGSMQYVLSPKTHGEDYRAATSWASAQNDIYNKDTLVMVAGNKYVVEGWKYYFSHKGERDVPNVCSIYSMPADLTAYATIYVNALHIGLKDDMAKTLEKTHERVNEAANLRMYVYQRK